jgi:hypothetical protein
MLTRMGPGGTRAVHRAALPKRERPPCRDHKTPHSDLTTADAADRACPPYLGAARSPGPATFRQIGVRCSVFGIRYSVFGGKRGGAVWR